MFLYLPVSSRKLHIQLYWHDERQMFPELFHLRVLARKPAVMAGADQKMLLFFPGFSDHLQHVCFSVHDMDKAATVVRRSLFATRKRMRPLIGFLFFKGALFTQVTFAIVFIIPDNCLLAEHTFGYAFRRKNQPIV